MSFLHIGIIMSISDKSIEEWIELINELRDKQGKIPWKLERTEYRPILYRIVTVADTPINLLLGRRYRKHNTIVDMLSLTYTLLSEESNIPNS